MLRKFFGVKALNTRIIHVSVLSYKLFFVIYLQQYSKRGVLELAALFSEQWHDILHQLFSVFCKKILQHN